MTENNLTIFEDHKIRRSYDKKSDTWFFSVVDVVGALTDSANPNDYIKKCVSVMKSYPKGGDKLLPPCNTINKR